MSRHDPDQRIAREASALPIGEVIAEVIRTLASEPTLLLEAPPGAGKTTIVPLALLQEPWLEDRRIVMLQPRRIAARNAAARMAELLGEDVGKTVGYRVRLDSRTSATTRIEVVTEGILLRMLQDDPALESVGLLIFDEFHERSLDADLGLALALYGRETFAAERAAKILVMSATLGEASLEDFLRAPRIRSEGRQYPVAMHHGAARQPRERIADRTVSTLERVVAQHEASSVLVFLPGRGEIERVAQDFSAPPGVSVHRLFGDLELAAQRRAIAPATGGERKVVLATNIAETSLTIEGVDVVVDAGLERQPRFDPNTGMSRLHLQPISRASATQRAGRAGRLRPGHCYRLWSEAQHRALAPQRAAEIEVADLAPLALQLFAWGIYDPRELRWLTAPPPGAFAQATELLLALGAVEQCEDSLRITPHGAAMAGLATHPRLAHLVLVGSAIGAAKRATLLAALLTEGLPRQGDAVDIEDYLEILENRDGGDARLRGWCHRTREVAAQLQRQIPAGTVTRLERPEEKQLPGYLLALAYPDRIARRRHSGGYQLANGRSANFAAPTPLQKSRWLAVAEVGGSSGRGSDTIRAAAVLDPALFDGLLAPMVSVHTKTAWDTSNGTFTAERQRRIGPLVLAREALSPVPDDLRLRSLLEHITESKLRALPWNDESENYRCRAALMQSVQDDWPDFSIAALAEEAEDWLSMYLAPVTRLRDLKNIDLLGALKARLSFAQQQLLEEWLPERIAVPSGSRHRIDYRGESPVLAVKLQEMFGLAQTPTLAGGRIPLTVHLLSPAGRPLQVTQDLRSFWENGYESVRKEMKGRYPRHPWPDDPLTAPATALTKKRLAEGKDTPR